MKKIFVLSLLSLMALPLMVQANFEGMMDSNGMTSCGTMWGSGWAMMLITLVYLALASFIFSLIFWLVHNWITKK